MDTYSVIKSRINSGELMLPTIHIPVFQVWVGGDIDDRVLELAALQRAACMHYTLVAPMNSPLVQILRPDKVVDVNAALEHATSKHAQVRAYLTRWGGNVEASDIIRFDMLSENAEQIYMDMDALLMKIPARFGRKEALFASTRTEADIFIMYGGGDRALFDGCLKALSPSNSQNALRSMVKTMPARIPEDHYFHYPRRMRL